MEIYKITNNINGKIYVGKDTTSDPKYYGSGKLIKRAIKKYGIDNFIKEVVDYSDDYHELSEKEKYWIKLLDSTNIKIGYNISNGGDGGDTLSNNPNLQKIREKISKNNPKTGKTYEEAFGVERAKEYKQKLKKNMHKSIQSDKVKLMHQERWKLYRETLRIRCEFIKKEIEKGNIKEYIDELRKIRTNSKTNIFKSLKSFYDFFGKDIKHVLDLNSKKSNLSTYQSKLIITDYYNDNQNENNVDFRTKRISINNIIYNSITEASNQLNFSRRQIRHRLESISYPEWEFLDGSGKIFFGEKQKKKVMILGVIYESIKDSVEVTGITRDKIKNRLKSDKYPDYIYL